MLIKALEGVVELDIKKSAQKYFDDLQEKILKLSQKFSLIFRQILKLKLMIWF